MSINRFRLIQAITDAREKHDDELYDELLKIYYRLLDQEDINGTFIVDFTMHSEVSDLALKSISDNLVAAH